MRTQRGQGNERKRCLDIRNFYGSFTLYGDLVRYQKRKKESAVTYKFYCGECARECNPVERDFGIGGYEFWGARSVDTRIETVSDCCDGDIYADPALEEQIEFSKD